jgi:hypothetical protein
LPPRPASAPGLDAGCKLSIFGHIPRAESSANGAGLLSKYVRSIRVEDVSGAQFELHEFVVPGWIWKARQFELDTGERARLVDENTFVLVSTGEHFMRVA